MFSSISLATVPAYWVKGQNSDFLICLNGDARRSTFNVRGSTFVVCRLEFTLANSSEM